MSDVKVKKVGSDLTEGNVAKQLIRFVLPLLAANIVQQLYNTVDMAVIGKSVGTIGTVGVSQGGEIATLITFTSQSFGSAAQIYTAQLSGAKEHRSINEVIGTTLTLMLGMAAILAAICFVFSDVFLGWISCPPEAMGQAHMYLRIVALGFPFIFGYNAVSGILRGMGEAKRPLLFVSVSAVINVIGDFLLVRTFKMEAAGTAWATIISQCVSFLLSLWFLYRKKEEMSLDLGLHSFRLNLHHTKVLFDIGLPLIAQSVLIHFSQLLCSARINQFGLTASATNSVGNKVHKLINVFTSSINSGAGAMNGQNIGAKKYDRVRETVRTTILLSSVFAFLGILVSIFFPKQAYGLFTNDEAVKELGVVYMRIMIIIFALSPIQGAFTSVITASGNSKLSFLSGILDSVVLRVGISFLLAYTFDMGILGFFWGNSLCRLGPVAVGVIYYLSNAWEHVELVVKRKEAVKE
ncbi:MAG: MATE family efflux transporter [Oscillospiraceae bacterium]|nr:MATE family efflux transporter [Oscillospiraceae bacterium]